MPIFLLPVFITCILFLNACAIQAPAPVEQNGVQISQGGLQGQPQGQGQEQTQSQFPINTTSGKFGVLLPLSGPNAALGQSMLQAAQLTLFDQGNTGISLIPIDTKGTIAGGRKAAEQALNQNADIIIGPVFSNAVIGAKEVTVPNNVKLIAFSNNETLADRVTFLMGFMPANQAKQIADYALDRNLKRYAIIAPQNKYGELVAKEFEARIKDNGGAITNKIMYLPNDPAIQSKIATLSDSQIDAVFIPASGTDLERITQALTTAGLSGNRVKRLGTALWDNPQTAQNKELENAWFASNSTTQSISFKRQYQSTYGTAPMMLDSLAYDATALASVMAGQGYNYNSFIDPNGFSGLDGVFRFSDQGIIERQLAIYEIKDSQITEIQNAKKSF